MVCAGYCMYGSMTYLMLTMGDRVSGFTLDNSIGARAGGHSCALHCAQASFQQGET